MFSFSNDYRLIKKSDLFDPIYYLTQYKENLPTSVDPISHYLREGWLDGYNPSQKFNTLAYLEMNPDVLSSKMNPLVHYLRYGKKEKREFVSVNDNLAIEYSAIRKVKQNKKNGEILITENVISAQNSLQETSSDNERIKALIDDYFDLYFQFTKFKEKPLIRIANKLDQIFPENGVIQKLMESLVSYLSSLRKNGGKQFFNLQKVQKGKAEGTLETIGKNFLLPLKLGSNLELSEENLLLIRNYFSENPVQVPDIIVFSPNKFEEFINVKNSLIKTLVDFGCRIFYFRPRGFKEAIPDLQVLENNTFLVNYDHFNGLPIEVDSFLSENDDSLFKLIFKIRNSYNIHSAIQIVNSTNFNNLSKEVERILGWKILYNFPENISKIGKLSNRELNDDQNSLNNYDLLLTESNWQQGIFKNIFSSISIIIVTFNNLSLTKTCLASIKKNTEYPNYELIIVDNNSEDGTKEFLEEFKKSDKAVKIIINNENLGFAAANNQGVEISSGDNIVFLNNDTVVTPGWLFELQLHLQKNPGTGMVGPVTNAIGNEAKIDIDFSDLSQINYFSSKRSADYFGKSFDIKVLALYCSMMSRKLFETLGGLDEQFRVGMFEDDDLAMKIRNANMNLICAEDVFIYHVHGASFKKIDDFEIQRIFHENRAKFENKWGVKWIPHQHKKR